MTGQPHDARQSEASAISRLVEEMMADFFAVPAGELDDFLAFNQVIKWDSLGHAELMGRLAAILPEGLEAGAEAHLLSVGSIRHYVRSGTLGAATAAGAGTFQRGLRGIAYAETRICEVDEYGGDLRYCSLPVEGLVDRDFLEIVHLLVWGSLGRPRSLHETATAVWNGVREASYADLDPAAELIAALAARPVTHQDSPEGSALACVGYLDGMVARLLHSSAIPPPLPASRNGLARLLLGPRRNAAQGEAGVRLLNACLVLQAEHGSNASTFVSRVVASCGAGTQASVVAACAAFFGPRHGGACAEAGELLLSIGSGAEAAQVVELRLVRGGALPGFGHGVYKVRDPRTAILRRVLEEAAAEISAAAGWLVVLDELEAEVQARYRRGFPSNIDAYLAAAYLALGFTPAQFGYLFASARVAGWVAHALEQAADGSLIRPRLACRRAPVGGRGEP